MRALGGESYPTALGSVKYSPPSIHDAFATDNTCTAVINMKAPSSLVYGVVLFGTHHN